MSNGPYLNGEMGAIFLLMRSAYLTTSVNTADLRLRVRLVQSLANVVRDWTPTSRCSPIFGLSDDERSDETHSVHRSLHFFALAHPEEIRDVTEGRASIWLSLGCYNVIAVDLQPADAQLLESWCHETEIGWERWTLDSDGYVTVHVHAPVPDLHEAVEAVIGAAEIDAPSDVVAHSTEYAPLMAIAITRSAQWMPQVYPEMQAIAASQLERLLHVTKNASESNRLAAVADFATLNAGLSRFTSQAFAGTSPILTTESHYWPHSLLGTGLANLALRNYCSFAFSVLGDFRLPERMQAYSSVQDAPDLKTLLPTDPYLLGAPIAVEKRVQWVDAAKIPSADQLQSQVPVVSFFSGRDGYKCTARTISAPLTVISGANSPRWPFQTVTHEISHYFIRAVLVELYAHPSMQGDPTIHSVDDARKELVGDTPRTSLLGRLRRYLIECVLLMHSVEKHFADAQGQKAEDASGKNIVEIRGGSGTLLKILRRWKGDVDEMMTHIFDYLNFFEADTERYLRSIWLSWSAQPHLGDRVSEYVLRSALAVLSKHTRRIEGAEALALKEVGEELDRMSANGQQSEYIERARAHIASDSAELVRRLQARRPLAVIVKHFIHSEEVAQALNADPFKGKYPHVREVFSPEPLQNPLLFAKEFTDGREPSAVRAMWLHYNLALNYDGR